MEIFPGFPGSVATMIWISIEMTIGSLKQIAEKAANCYKKAEVEDSAFLRKVLQFYLIWRTSVMRFIMQ